MTARYTPEDLGFSRPPHRECGCGEGDGLVRRRSTQGNTLVFTVQVFQPLPGGGQAPQNITGWFAWCTLKRALSDPDRLSLAQVTSQPTSAPPGGGIVFTQPLSGFLQVTIPAQATRDMSGGTEEVFYDVKVQDTAGRVFTVEPGIYYLDPSSTHAIGAYAGGGNWPPEPVQPVPVITGSNSPYDVDPSTPFLEFDGDDGAQGRAVLPPNPTIDEHHEFVQTGWTVSTPPPVIDAGPGRAILLPEVSPSGSIAQTIVITPFGGSVKVRWDGSVWVAA
jgi:hypothetical protein